MCVKNITWLDRVYNSVFIHVSYSLYLFYPSLGLLYARPRYTKGQGRTGSTLGPRATIVVGGPHSVLGRGGGAEVVGPRAVPYCPYGQSAPAKVHGGLPHRLPGFHFPIGRILTDKARLNNDLNVV